MKMPTTTANGMTRVETIGMTARLANRLSGETRWKCQVAKTLVALPAIIEVATARWRSSQPAP